MNSKATELATYIAKHNPNGVIILANMYGYRHPKSEQGSVGLLCKMIAERGTDAFKDLAMIHPDRELLLATKDFRPFTHMYEPSDNFVGESSNAAGQTQTVINQATNGYVPPKKDMPTLVMVVIIIVAGLIAAVVSKN